MRLRLRRHMTGAEPAKGTSSSPDGRLPGSKASPASMAAIVIFCRVVLGVC
jgi:hypothetical protein